MHVLKKTICLIGMPGSGKTTLARMMGDHYELPVVDLDNYIGHELKTTISKLWVKEGELMFRCIERFYLLKTLCGNPAILSTGGGTPCFFDNLSMMNSLAFSVYLKSDKSHYAENLKTNNHPIFSGAQDTETRWKELLQQRSAYYERANLILKAYNHEPNVFEAVSKNCLHKGIIKIN